MSEISIRLRQGFADFLAYAYKTLSLSFLFVSVLRFLFHNGGWINYFIIFLALSSVFALSQALYRLLTRS